MKLRLWEIHAASSPAGETPAGPPDDNPADGPPEDHSARGDARGSDEDECCALLRPNPPRQVSTRRRVWRGARER